MPGLAAPSLQGLGLGDPLAPTEALPRVPASQGRREKREREVEERGDDPREAGMKEGRGPVIRSIRENEGAGARAIRRRWPRKIYGTARVPRTG